MALSTSIITLTLAIVRELHEHLELTAPLCSARRASSHEREGSTSFSNAQRQHDVHARVGVDLLLGNSRVR